MKLTRYPYYILRVENHLGVSMAFPRFLVLGMHIGRTHLQSGQPFHMHPDSNYNMDYLQPHGRLKLINLVNCHDKQLSVSVCVCVSHNCRNSENVRTKILCKYVKYTPNYVAPTLATIHHLKVERRISSSVA